MVFDLRRALLAKEERESARLMDFAFRLRARTFRLLAIEIGRDPAALALLAAQCDDARAIQRLQSELPDTDLADLFATAQLKARRELKAELGDPAPHRLA